MNVSAGSGTHVPNRNAITTIPFKCVFFVMPGTAERDERN